MLMCFKSRLARWGYKFMFPIKKRKKKEAVNHKDTCSRISLFLRSRSAAYIDWNNNTNAVVVAIIIKIWITPLGALWHIDSFRGPSDLFATSVCYPFKVKHSWSRFKHSCFLGLWNSLKSMTGWTCSVCRWDNQTVVVMMITKGEKISPHGDYGTVSNIDHTY